MALPSSVEPADGAPLPPLLSGTMALQRGDIAAARAAVEAMPQDDARAAGAGTRAELETLVLLGEVAVAEGNPAAQGPLLEQLRQRAGVTLDVAKVCLHPFPSALHCNLYVPSLLLRCLLSMCKMLHLNIIVVGLYRAKSSRIISFMRREP